jgi:hypothetical protein
MLEMSERKRKTPGPMRKLTQLVLATALASAAMYGGACVAPDKLEDPTPDMSDVIFEGNANSSALVPLLAVDPVADTARGPLIVNPPPDSVLSAASIVTFEWSPEGPTALRGPLPSERARPASAPPSLLPAEITAARAAAPEWLAALLGSERAAAAAARLPLDGRGYLLLFTTAEIPRLLRVFTTHTSYTPDKTAWARLRTAGDWTTLTVISATFFKDRLAPAAGPYVGESIDFCIEEQ